MIKPMKGTLIKILGVAAVAAMLVTSLVAPVAAMAAPTLAVGSTTVSAATPYTISFTTGAAQTGNTAGIVVTFGTGVVVGTPAVTIQISGTTTLAQTTITTDTTIAGQVATINTLGPVTIGNISSGAAVKLTFTNITNPAAAGNISVTVSTSGEPTAVASNVIAITAAASTTTTTTTTTGTTTTTAVPTGGAQVFSSTGTLITASNDLAVAIAAVQSQNLTGATIKLAAGTYNSAYPASTTIAFTIQGNDANAANVILKSNNAWALTGPAISIDKVTIDASSGGVLTIGGASTTAASITNSFLKGGAVVMAAAGANATNTVNADTFTVAAGADGVVASAPTTVTASTFNTSGNGISGQANVTVGGCTFTGNSGAGTGITLTGGAASSVTSSTFTGLATALTLSNAAAGVSFNGNTVTSCGVAGKSDAIIINATAGTSIFNNNVNKSLNNIISVTSNDALVTVMLNAFSGNAGNAVDTAGGILNCTHNFWSGTNPASVATVSYSNPLGAAPTAANYVTGASGITLTASKTAGVNIPASSKMSTIGAAALGANPVSAALPSTLKLVQYFDVFGMGNSAATATVDFFGTAANPVAAGSTVYFYNLSSSTWVIASNVSVNTAGNYVEITIAPSAGSTPATAPSPAQFEGTPFALVNTVSTTTTGTTTVTTTSATTSSTTGTGTTTTKTTTPVSTTKTTATTTTNGGTTTSTSTSKPVISSTLLYAVIGAAAVLFIALIILIIRSRKP
jgi:hypothetical protein